jgi:hypothetical protein
VCIYGALFFGGTGVLNSGSWAYKAGPLQHLVLFLFFLNNFLLG